LGGPHDKEKTLGGREKSAKTQLLRPSPESQKANGGSREIAQCDGMRTGDVSLERWPYAMKKSNSYKNERTVLSATKGHEENKKVNLKMLDRIMIARPQG